VPPYKSTLKLVTFLTILSKRLILDLYIFSGYSILSLFDNKTDRFNLCITDLKWFLQLSINFYNLRARGGTNLSLSRCVRDDRFHVSNPESTIIHRGSYLNPNALRSHRIRCRLDHGFPIVRGIRSSFLNIKGRTILQKNVFHDG
jgi:hypothetical protein